MTGLQQRAAEVADKLAILRAHLKQASAGAFRLRGVDWFAWVTAGGSSAVLHTTDHGVAEVLVTPEEACILTDAIEGERLRAEEIPEGFTFHIEPWAEPELRERYVLNAASGRSILSDRPAPSAGHGEQPLPYALRQRRLVLGADECERYRALGREASEAMGEVLRMARPDWTEYQLAGAGAEALWRRGIHPALVLAAGERRLPAYRHATPSNEAIGARAMLVFCARRHGLYANLTRFVSFGPAPLDQQRALMEVEATGLAAVQAGKSLAAVYHALEAAYRHADREAAIREHHQGGITGYRAREIVASPSTATLLEEGMAFAFNPSFAGVKIEDTFLLGPDGLENLTFDPGWPAVDVHGRKRPLWLEQQTW
ncbi:M24 family metallopeptidase [Massilia yuzhufengensis]|uniref:Metallopeptidase family M24 n=1 Tax=Massilia yuzhufengensis TaxID=1164594 RepID=A0A1I1TP09_9BURK|nr:M24 family metallopeptidase [Massilia yuzhufengensis]SFD58233.1 Metallopeptidase family M24 [Massilia yuzhufengensis]